MSDQRRAGRWKIGRPAKIKLFGAYAFAQCYVKDIGFKGAHIALTIKLPQNAFVKICLHLTDDVILDAEVWVAWHKVIDGINHYGLYFSRIADPDKEKIFSFMKRDFPVQLYQKWQGKEEKGGMMDQQKNYEDRRVFERFPVNFPVRFLSLGLKQEGSAHACDISAKGIGFISKTKLTPHLSLELWMDMPDNGEPLYTRGEVAWSKPSGNNEYRTGISLEKADFMGLGRALRAK